MDELLSSNLFIENADKSNPRISDDTFSDIMLDKITESENHMYLSCYCTYNDINT